MSTLRCRVIGVLALALSLTTGLRPRAAGESNGCELSTPDAAWVQRALDGWELVRHDFLSLQPGALPWIVLFDASCQWHINPTDPRILIGARPHTSPALTFNGNTLDVRASSHGGTVLLPNRVEIPMEVKASTALYRNGRMTFLVMAMPSVWRSERQYARNPHLDEYLLGAFTHEMTHSRQLVSINRRLRQVIGSADIPARLNDDAVQERFHKEPGFARLIDRETAMLFRAVGLSDPAARRAAASNALAMIRERHARYYTGKNAPYAEIETLFLTMEGAGQWAAYKLIKARRSVGASDAEAQRLVRDNRRYWSQDQGLALFLLLDQLVPDWQPRIFHPEPASPFKLLEDALSK